MQLRCEVRLPAGFSEEEVLDAFERYYGRGAFVYAEPNYTERVGVITEVEFTDGSFIVSMRLNDDTPAGKLLFEHAKRGSGLGISAKVRFLNTDVSMVTIEAEPASGDVAADDGA